jgi:hypothetical protein
MPINTQKLQKELREGIIKKIRGVLTSEEFAQVKFDPLRPEWQAPELIQKKILAGLK